MQRVVFDSRFSPIIERIAKTIRPGVGELGVIFPRLNSDFFPNFEAFHVLKVTKECDRMTTLSHVTSQGTLGRTSPTRTALVVEEVMWQF